jgi:hypothetical protein
MSKTLLTESEIRKMMGLANLGPLGSNFVSRLQEQEIAEPEEGEEDPMAMADEDPMAADPADAGDEDPGAEAEAPGEDEAMEAATEQLVSAVIDAINNLPGAPKVSMEPGEMGDDEMAGDEMDMGPEAEEAEAGMEPSPEGEEDEEAADAALAEALRRAGVKLTENLSLDEYLGMDEDDMGEGMYEDDMEEGMYEDDMGEDMMEAVPLEDELVNEVTRRVSARLVKRLKR